jgi:uncharacterized protein
MGLAVVSPSSHEVFGAPCWVGLMARDLRAAERFYGAVFGWEFRPTRLGEEFSVAFLEGAPVAGIGALAGRLAVAVALAPTSPSTTRTRPQRAFGSAAPRSRSAR